METDSFKLAEKLWDLANIITGFAVIHNLAICFTLAKDDLKALKGREAHWTAFGCMVLFNAMYGYGIYICGLQTHNLIRDSKTIAAWDQINRGRMICVVVFLCVLVLALIGHRKVEIQAHAEAVKKLATTSK